VVGSLAPCNIHSSTFGCNAPIEIEAEIRGINGGRLERLDGTRIKRG